MSEIGDRDAREQAALWIEVWRTLGVTEILPATLAAPHAAAAVEPAETGAPANVPDFVQAPRLAFAGEARDDADRALIEAAVADPDPAHALLRLRRDALGECRRCKLCDGRTNIVFGVGDPRARLMFVGEGPGADEDAKGEPFVGRAGQLLDRIIAAMGLSRPQVYIGNVVKCRPPDNREPEPDEEASCLPYLRAQIRIIKPEVIVTLGRVPLAALLQQRLPGITKLRGQWFHYEGIPLLATFHPAYLLRNPAAKRPVWEDMQAVMQKLGLPSKP